MELISREKSPRDIVGYQLQDPHSKEYYSTVAVYFKDFESGDRCVYVDIKDLEPEDVS